ncbi:MAG TPA: NADH-quinone oxidoreductase subunit NuoE [Ktedonobacterales bacterium]|nr:NADH-quinone oxidoreductase subunit NuoE [Ktedonobacterales bacterium]
MISEALMARMREAVARYPSPRSAMLPCLHLAQDELGYIPDEAVVAVAEVIGVKPDEVESIITFYSMLHKHPQGRYVLKVCASVSCYLCGADDTLAILEARLGVGRGETTADGQFTIESAECLAGCGMAPVMQVNGLFVEQATQERAEEVVAYLKAGGDVAEIRNRWRATDGAKGMTTETTIGAEPANGASPAKNAR